MRFVVPGKLNTDHRPRFADGRTYKSKGYRSGLSALRLCAQAAFAGVPWRLDGRFYVAIKTHEPDLRQRDLDNATKPVLDALTGVAWHDDKQVCGILVERGDIDRVNPSTHVTVRRLP